jgi:hypothetical protein
VSSSNEPNVGGEGRKKDVYGAKDSLEPLKANEEGKPCGKLP